MLVQLSPRLQYVAALLQASLVSAGLLGYHVVTRHNFNHSFLLWNLFLAWLPLLLAGWLTEILGRKLWSSWEALGVSLLWLLFLPNSFYMVSDFIHLREAAGGDILYLAVLYASFIITALLLGFTSLLLVHTELAKRYNRTLVRSLVAAILLACSVAIYIGRDLRWNSWDILINPSGLLFDLSDRLLHPATYPEMLVTVGSFFVLLTTLHMLVWSASQALRQLRR